jgi:hypothetical protein
MNQNKNNEKSIIRSELNLEKWPMFTTSTFKGNSKTIVRRVMLPSGEVDERKVIIGKINNVEVGVFRIFDFKGFCALVKLWEEQGRPSDKNVYFSFYKIAEILGLSGGGRSNVLIKEMLSRLRKIPIDWINSFYNREEKEMESLLESFTILSDLVIFEKSKGKNGQPSLAISSFSFDKRLIANWLNNYSKPLVLDDIFKFKKEISILLYRYVDLMMADKVHYERVTADLISELDLPQNAYPYPAQRKKLFDPVVKELQGVEISTGVITNCELIKTVDGKDWKIVVDKEKRDTLSKRRLPVEIEHEPDSIEGQLIKRGLTKNVAQKLCQQHPKEYIAQKIGIFDVLREGKSKLVSKNPAGWLRMAIERDYVSPVVIESETDKKRKREALEAQKQAIEKRHKIDEYVHCLTAAPETKIWWKLNSWKKEYVEQHGEAPDDKLLQQKQQELIDALPNREKYQIDIFGKVIYTEEDDKRLIEEYSKP